MTWQELFSNIWRGDEVEIRIFDHLRRPDKLTSADSIALYDRSAAETIRRMEDCMEALKGYRQALAERYAVLATMPYTLRLDLRRHKGWCDKRVTYTLRLVRVYQDGHEEVELEKVYSGVQRREAIKEFEDMKRQRPGIACVFEIEKARWER